MVDATKLRLVEAAGEVFADKGFEAASIREICQRAEANIAAVNYHFGDKRQLYVAAVRHAQTCSTESMFPPGVDITTIPATEQLELFIRTMLRQKLDPSQPRWHLELMLREMTRPTEACAQVVDDYIRPLADILATILHQLLPNMPPEQRAWEVGFSIVAQVLFYQFNQPIIQLLMGNDGYRALSVDRLAKFITHFSLAALGYAVPLNQLPALELAGAMALPEEPTVTERFRGGLAGLPRSAAAGPAQYEAVLNQPAAAMAAAHLPTPVATVATES